MMELSERIRWLMREKGLSNGDLARIAEVKPASVSGWINGSSKSLKGQTALNIAKRCRISPAWLVNGVGTPDDTGAKFMGNVPFMPQIVLTEESVAYIKGIAQFRAIEKGANMAYTDEEVKALGGSRLESVHLVRVWDSSMAPLLLQGDFVLIDLERTDYHQKGVFLIRMKDQLYLRILQPRVSGGVVIKTLDPTSTTEVIEGSKMDDFEVVGRVLEKRGQAGLS